MCFHRRTIHGSCSNMNLSARRMLSSHLSRVYLFVLLYIYMNMAQPWRRLHLTGRNTTTVAATGRIACLVRILMVGWFLDIAAESRIPCHLCSPLTVRQSAMGRVSILPFLPHWSLYKVPLIKASRFHSGTLQSRKQLTKAPIEHLGRGLI